MPSACPARLAIFFNDPATTEFYPLPLHDALPISRLPPLYSFGHELEMSDDKVGRLRESDRKSTRLNSSHVSEPRMPSSAFKQMITEQMRRLPPAHHALRLAQARLKAA